MTRALLFQSKLPKQYWSYIVLHAIYIISRVPTPILENNAPYIVLNGHDPDLHTLKVLGSICYASIFHSHRTKLEPRARKCVFLRYKYNVKGAVLINLNNREMFVYRDVTFMNIFYHTNPPNHYVNGITIPLIHKRLVYNHPNLLLSMNQSLTLQQYPSLFMIQMCRNLWHQPQEDWSEKGVFLLTFHSTFTVAQQMQSIHHL